jgi:DNA mismatch repair protein MutL
MPKEDARLAIKKHTTSKISKASDLFKIKSLGFRGEALSSMAAVSNMEITTKTADDSEGFCMEIEDGKIKSEKTAACNIGTTIKVNDLFYNTPVRKKHLKDISVELRHITQTVIRYALVNQIGIKLIHNGKTIINCPENIDELGRIINIFGKNFGKHIGRPILTRADKDGIMIYINSRYIKNKAISDAVYDAYHTLLGTQRYPVAILNIKIPNEKVDVNVHPTKIEVRIEKEHLVCSSILDLIKEKLEQTELVPKVEAKKQATIFTEPEKVKKKDQDKFKHAPLDTKASKQQEIKIEPVKVEVPAYNVLGIIHKTFVIVETKHGMRIIDQHAAHERILYERFMNSVGKDGIKKQALLQPIKKEVSADDVFVVSGSKEIFDYYGMQVEEFGKNTILIRTLPSVLGNQLSDSMFSDLVSEIKKNKNKKSVEAFKESMIITMSCRAAEKAGDVFEMSEIHELIKQLEACRQPYTCPHGRPTMIDYTVKDLEKSVCPDDRR